jgi:3-hydroxyisobutyrate dehydrogenase-like beta-hydroxyacid dehydrogenase
MGKDIIYVGQAGAGQIAKLSHNMLVAAITVGLAEAFAVGSKAGVSPETLAKVIDSGTAHNRVLAVFGPTMLEGTFEQVKFSLGHMHKDISLYTKTAFDYGVPSFVGSLVAQVYESAKANGKGHLDSSAVYQTILEMANMTQCSHHGKKGG